MNFDLNEGLEELHKEVNEDRPLTQNEAKLDKEFIKEINDSLVPLTLHNIRHLHKRDLLITILRREEVMHEIQIEFQKSLKQKDRDVFKNMKKEIIKLRKLLYNRVPLYKEVILLQNKVTKLQAKLNFYR